MAGYGVSGRVWGEWPGMRWVARCGMSGWIQVELKELSMAAADVKIALKLSPNNT